MVGGVVGCASPTWQPSFGWHWHCAHPPRFPATISAVGGSKFMPDLKENGAEYCHMCAHKHTAPSPTLTPHIDAKKPKDAFFTQSHKHTLFCIHSSVCVYFRFVLLDVLRRAGEGRSPTRLLCGQEKGGRGELP
jgi:hypothetical protein